MSFLPMKTPNPLLPPKSPLENGYDMLRWLLGMSPPQGIGFPTMPELPGGPPQGPDGHPLFQGLLYEPPVGKGLLNIPDPDSGPRPFPGGNAPASMPPAFGARGSAPSLANAPQQFPLGDLRAVTASLSHSALPPPRIAPEPEKRNAPPALSSDPYATGGLRSAAGGDWIDGPSVAGFRNPPSPFGEAAANVFDPPRSQGYSNFQRVAAAAQGQSARTAAPPRRPRLIIDTESLLNAGHKEKFAYSVIAQAEGDKPDKSGDPNNPNPPVTGIRQDLIQEFSPKINGLDPDSRPDQLTPQQRAQIYRAYFDRELSDAFGHETLEHIGHTGVAAFVADSVFREGAKGKRMIQESINSVLEAQRQRGFDVDKIRVNGRFNMETLYTLNKIIENGDYRQQLLREIKLRRDESHTSPKTWKGEAFRTQHVYELGTAKDQ